mgnify:CR=1 FL=1
MFRRELTQRPWRLHIAVSDQNNILPINHVSIRFIAIIAQDENNSMRTLGKNVAKITCPVYNNAYHTDCGPVFKKGVGDGHVHVRENVAIIARLLPIRKAIPASGELLVKVQSKQQRNAIFVNISLLTHLPYGASMQSHKSQDHHRYQIQLLNLACPQRQLQSRAVLSWLPQSYWHSSGSPLLG